MLSFQKAHIFLSGHDYLHQFSLAAWLISRGTRRTYLTRYRGSLSCENSCVSFSLLAGLNHDQIDRNGFWGRLRSCPWTSQPWETQEPHCSSRVGWAYGRPLDSLFTSKGAGFYWCNHSRRWDWPLLYAARIQGTVPTPLTETQKIDGSSTSISL